MSPSLSDYPSLMLGIAIHCIQHSQAMLERGVFASSLFLSFVCIKEQFSDQNINVAKEAEIILRNIEKYDISLFIN